MRTFLLWVSRVVPALTLVYGVGCGDDAPADPCPTGICASDGGGGIDGGPGRDGGPGVDSGPGADVGADGAVPPGTCVWECTPWDTGGSGDDATRTCTETADCGSRDGKPAESVTLPALNADFYECQIEPIMARGCGQLGCHGSEEGRSLRLYTRGRLRITGRTLTERGCTGGSRVTNTPSEQCIGSIERCNTAHLLPEERRLSFDSARGFALSPDGTLLDDMTRSELIAQPQIGGGFSHAGIHFWNAGDADHQTIQRWLEGASQGSCNSGS